MCDQTLEELPLEFESASRPSSTFDAMGLPPPAARGNTMSPALYNLVNGDFASPQSPSSYLGSPRVSKSRRSFHSEHTGAANGVVPSATNTGGGSISSGAGYPVIKSDR